MLAALFLLLSLRALMVGLRSRRLERREFYNVGRLEARRKLFRNMFATISLIVVALILATVALFFPNQPEETADSDLVEAVQGIALEMTGQTEPDVASELSAPSSQNDDDDANAALVVEADDNAPALPTPSLTPTLAPTPTATPSPTPRVVFVNSPVVGLYLRNGPGGEILLLLDDQTPLTVIGEIEVIDEIEWMNVSGGEGEIGWVAADYVSDTPPPTETPSLDPELESETTPTEPSP